MRGGWCHSVTEREREMSDQIQFIKNVVVSGVSYLTATGTALVKI